MMKSLLKLGGIKHLGEARWIGALTLFDDIHCTCIYREPLWNIPSEKVNIYQLKRTPINKALVYVLSKIKNNRSLNVLNHFIVYMLRLINRQWIKKIKSVKADYILCSYGDYDWSALSLLLCRKAIRGKIVRAYKESRIDYDFLEYYSFKCADKIVLYAEELKKFIENKYGNDFFAGKKVLIGYDENALPSCILDNIKYRKKLSEKDNKTHMVILSYRVDSTPYRERDLDRYYYVEIIEKLINAGLIVHLHCAVYNSIDGINRYELLQKKYPGEFFMEGALKMNHASSAEEWIHACEILSRYDVGLLHNITDESKVSEFDRINIPHRFYAYEAAHVLPVIHKGENIVLERIFNDKNCGYTYNRIDDIAGIHHRDFNYYTPSYEQYLKDIFNL